MRDSALAKINVELFVHNLKKDSRKLISRERESSACTFSFSFLTKHFFLHFVAVVEATEARRKEFSMHVVKFSCRVAFEVRTTKLK